MSGEWGIIILRVYFDIYSGIFLLSISMSEYSRPILYSIHVSGFNPYYTHGSGPTPIATAKLHFGILKKVEYAYKTSRS